MRDWKNWLFPLLTCLIAVGLALLPLKLSIQEDRQLSGVVHSEALREDSNFPAKVPELPGRIRLLAQYGDLPDALTIMDQILEGDALDNAAAQVQAELRRLAAAGILPEESIENLTGFYGRRLYLRNQADLSSASFLEINAYSKEQETDFSLYLDCESGRILALRLTGWPVIKYPVTASEIGTRFLEGWDVPYTEREEYKENGRVATFAFPESQALYHVFLFSRELSIGPETDWDLLDKMSQGGAQIDPNTSASIGYDA